MVHQESYARWRLARSGKTDDTKIKDGAQQYAWLYYPARIIQKFFEKGAVVKTKGEFSHEKNPIDLVQNGQKVGEATGGEYIFNPQQSEKMKELAKQATEARSEDKRLSAMEKLAKFVRELLNRFEKDAQ